MKKIVLTLGLMPILLWATENSYRYQIDLTQLKNDQLTVTLNTPKIASDSAYFSFPKMVPGTYSISDFGRFIENVQAFDMNGKSISNTKIDDNTWLITPAQNLTKIQYIVNDTYDAIVSNPIFEPAGNNFEKDSNYILNLFATLGYFDGKLTLPLSLSITHAPSFFGSTSLKDLNKSDTRDSFQIENYHVAVDNPILYCVPDTATVMVGNTEVLISIYSTHKANRAEKIAKSLSDLLKAQGDYLGGVLPVDKYSFLIYIANHDGLTGGYGALEHAYCSMYFLPEMPDAVLIPQLREIAAHEFFHIVTPLNIHSKEIQFFDYDHPKMSAHLWLYEGTTEYHAHAVQVKYGFTKPAEFLSTLREKMTQARFAFNDTVPFTTLSLGVLDSFEKEYPNVYAKGALIGLCLELKLLQESNGKYGLMDLINDLAKKYGKDTSFEDAELFDVITKVTYPSIGEFLKKHVAGNSPLPFKEYLDYVGVSYTDIVSTKGYSLGQIELGFDPKSKKIFVNSTKNMNDFGRAMGYQEGDIFASLNGKKATPINFKIFRDTWAKKIKKGDKLKIEMLRPQANGTYKKVKLSSPVFESESKQYDQLSFSPKASETQLALRKAWLEKR